MHHGAFAFDGETYQAEFDFNRLKTQLQAVFALMQDGKWRSLEHIATATNSSTPSASARLRDLRKDKFGGHDVQRMRTRDNSGLWLYRVIVNVDNDHSGASSVNGGCR